MTPQLRSALQRTLGTGYRIDRELGGGGMSQVFLATDLALARQVVVKVLSQEMSAGVSADRFRREIQLVAKLQHPHVVPLLAAGDAEGALYYIMPFISGEPLRARLAREGPMPVGDTIRILRETLDALAFAHSHGVIHRDIKPDNILIGAGHAVVADFGVSKALQDSSAAAGGLTSAGIALGTPAYMAPEQAAADPNTDHRADLYAVAVVAYEMLTGAPPFVGTPSQLLKSHLADTPTPIKQRRSDVPDALADMVMRALSKDPEQRPQSAAEMMSALDIVTTPGGTQASIASAIPAASNRRPIPRLVFAGALAVFAIGAVATWYARRAPVIASAQSIAITPFSAVDGDTLLTRIGQNLVTLISASLDGVGAIRVADGTAVLSHARQQGPLLSVQHAVTIAQKLGARSAVHGTLTRAGTTVRADAALYDVTNATEPTVRVTASAHVDSIAALTDSLSWALLRAVWAAGKAPTPNVSTITTRSPVALREFLEGERLFGRALQEQAAVHYLKAVAADTTFWFAHYRYWISRAWLALPFDTSVTSRLRRHIDDIPVPERLLVDVVFREPSFARRLSRLAELRDQYPSFVEGQMYLADQFTHHAMRLGYHPREALEPWRRVGALTPTDLNAWEHLIFVCSSIGDAECLADAASRLDSLGRSDGQTYGATTRSMVVSARYAVADRAQRKVMADSLLSVVSADSIAMFAPNVHPAMVGRDPTIAADVDELSARIARIAQTGRTRLGFDPLLTERFNAFSRGDVSQLGAITASLGTMPAEIRALVEPGIPPVMVLLELQGLRDAEPATAAAAIASLNNPALGNRARAELRWIAAVNGLLRGDSALVREQTNSLRTDTTAGARIALRSIRALGLGFGGNTAAAADSLAAIERVHADSAPKVWGAFAANRLMASQWLTDHGKPALADSLIRFTQGTVITSTALAAFPISGAANLQRSRIAEAMGDPTRAVAEAKLFLATYDKPSPRAKPWVTEAEERIRRMGGSVEPAPRKTTP
ncbi:MAG: serine/threonine-protein kinase [Gemmatimonadota bacterium]|nr:serine/threonine-protein kinase [Gemmatimonadota bacterium]